MVLLIEREIVTVLVDRSEFLAKSRRRDKIG